MNGTTASGSKATSSVVWSWPLLVADSPFECGGLAGARTRSGERTTRTRDQELP